MRKRLSSMTAASRNGIGVQTRDPNPQNLRETFQKDFSISERQPVKARETKMRYFLIIASALFAFGATMTFESTDANAVVCARGVVRAGCAGARGAVVVRKPVVACQWVWVGGVKVRRCV
jgi:hypothetical protein